MAASNKTALSGRIVCMDDAFTVIPHGIVYISGDLIVAAQAASAPPPAGFDASAVVDTGGTIYPGLIELHNHLSYNALRLWNVPKKYTNRDQWASADGYHQLVTGPMKVLAGVPDLMPALVRWVESKCLFAGVTTSQGVALSSDAGIRRYYKGVIRTAEQPDRAGLPHAQSHIADVLAADAQKFLTEIQRATCLLLHLSEGTDAAARQHFLSLQLPGDRWAITGALAGIHCAALQAADFNVLAAHGGSMVWSPLSNLLLYGATANVQAAKTAGVRMALGSDWSPSGSKNLLGELKAAHVYSQNNGVIFSDRDLVAMATRNPAAILKWDKLLGSVEKGKLADLLVIAGAAGDPYTALIAASEASIRLVMIGGTPRFGAASLIAQLNASGESWRIGGQDRTIHLDGTALDPDVARITLADAQTRLADALNRLPDLAKAPPPKAPQLAGAHKPTWHLALDELEDTGVDLRTHFATARGAPTGASRPEEASVPPHLQPLTLDPLTVVDDPDFLKALDRESNLPAYMAPGVRALYR
jgi:cytosine/adenosine deaminase-related metal-dependent hydrolase